MNHPLGAGAGVMKLEPWFQSASAALSMDRFSLIHTDDLVVNLKRK